MSEVLERAGAPDDVLPDTTASGPVAPQAQLRRASGFVIAGPLRCLVAALSAGAGVVHLAMVPSHMGEWAPEGVAFAVAGWVQLVVALLVVTRPSRALLWVTTIANAALLRITIS